MAEVITERITCRAFDITITRYIDATIIKFHTINEKIFKHGFSFYGSRNEQFGYCYLNVRTYNNPGIVIDRNEISFGCPIELPKNEVVSIESNSKYKTRYIMFQELANKYPLIKDPRPGWY